MFPLASAQDDSSKKSAIARVSRRLDRKRLEAQPPRIDSFLDFLTNHARVKSGSGYIPYSFAGREALQPIVEKLDNILASGVTDASLAICGGAQFGKTVLMLNLLAYLVAVRFRNVGYYLPDDDLVSGLVDGKLRPDVLDQIPWLARLIAVGKTVSPSGRAVNRKGAFLCTDGKRTALAFMRGLGKIPTSFSMDVVVQDEKDDLPEEHARFLAGRMTASNLRLSLLIGTQRYHGAGQNLAFSEGSQHVGLLSCSGCGGRHNPETLWPGICRLVVEGIPEREWPQLTVEGHFSFGNVEAPVASCSLRESGQQVVRTTRSVEGHFERRAQNVELRAGETEEGSEVESSKFSALSSKLIPFQPGQAYHLCCPTCGSVLDREHPQWHAQAPEREKERRWSYRISQLLIPGIDLAQIVAAWQLAIRDPEHMIVFCTDRLALPKSSTQTLTPHDLQAARGDYELRTKSLELRTGNTDSSSASSTFYAPSSSFVGYGGLDLGDQCWFVARAVEAKAPHTARLLWIEPMAAERVRVRVPELFRLLNLRAICVDAGPLRDLSRDLVFALNGLTEEGTAAQRAAATTAEKPVARTATATWHEASEKWRHVRCAAVEFTQREGQGLRHKVGRTQEGRLYPLLSAHRDETIQRVIAELLPPSETYPRLLELVDGTTRRILTPRFLLPMATDETRAVLDIYDRHLLAGARQERSADGRTLRYLDKCENHFLLATAYAALAELLAPLTEIQMAVPAFRAMPVMRSQRRRERSVVG